MKVVPIKARERGGHTAHLNPRKDNIDPNTIAFSFSRLQTHEALPPAIIWKLRELQLLTVVIDKNTKLRR